MRRGEQKDERNQSLAPGHNDFLWKRHSTLEPTKAPISQKGGDDPNEEKHEYQPHRNGEELQRGKAQVRSHHEHSDGRQARCYERSPTQGDEAVRVSALLVTIHTNTPFLVRPSVLAASRKWSMEPLQEPIPLATREHSERSIPDRRRFLSLLRG